jgi:hypothetical protein
MALLPQPGDRVRLIRMPSDPDPIAPGTEGTVCGRITAWQIDVEWDGDRTLMLIPDIDEWEIVS